MKFPSLSSLRPGHLAIFTFAVCFVGVIVLGIVNPESASTITAELSKEPTITAPLPVAPAEPIVEPVIEPTILPTPPPEVIVEPEPEPEPEPRSPSYCRPRRCWRRCW